MIEGIPKISVLVVSYNQEKVISRAIESLLAQKDYLYEICVSDDCSGDRTWDILQDYSAKYPSLFVLNRNEPNIGIFENIEKTWDMPTGDIVYRVAGDDECGEGWLQTVVEYIQEKKIDYKNEFFCIYGDYVGVAPDGKRDIHKNDMAKSSVNQFSLSLRGIIGNRSACYSIKILNQFFKVSQGRSHIAESAIDRQLQLFCKKNYYIPKIGNIYYSGIGESTKITNSSIFVERKKINPYMIERFAEYEYVPTKSDLRYIACDDAFLDFLKERNLKTALKYIYRWLLSYDYTIGIRSLRLKFVLSHLGKIFKS